MNGTTVNHEELRLRLEELIDNFVSRGADHRQLFDAIVTETENLRKAYEFDPDPADDTSGAVVEEASNDWPAAQE